MCAADDVRDRLAFGHMVDDLGLGQDRTDAADGLGIPGLKGQVSDLIQLHLKVSADSFQKSAASGGAFLIGAEGLDLASIAKGNGSSTLRSHVQDELRFGEERMRPTRAAG